MTSDRLRELPLFNLEKGRLQLSDREDQARHFSDVRSKNIRGNGHKQ